MKYLLPLLLLCSTVFAGTEQRIPVKGVLVHNSMYIEVLVPWNDGWEFQSPRDLLSLDGNYRVRYIFDVPASVDGYLTLTPYNGGFFGAANLITIHLHSPSELSPGDNTGKNPTSNGLVR